MHLSKKRYYMWNLKNIEHIQKQFYIILIWFLLSTALLWWIWWALTFHHIDSKNDLYPYCLRKLTTIASFVYQNFYLTFLPTLLIFLSSAVLITNNPIFSLFFLISLFFSAVLLLFSLGVEFLAMIYLIIYIGAISILFLFVIMMFNLKQLQRKHNTFFFWSTICIYGWAFPKLYNIFINILHTNHINYTTHKIFWLNNPYNFFIYQKLDILIFSQLFYTYYSYIFLLSGMLLLTAMLGSIVLALSTVENNANTNQFKKLFK